MAKKDEPIVKDFRIDFNVPQYLESRFATNFVVQRMGNLFKISLFEIKPDFILSPKDRKEFEKKGSINADCLASYIVSPESLENFVGIMTEQLERYNESKKEDS